MATHESNTPSTSEQENKRVFEAFPKPSAWALGWDGAALKKLLPGRRSASPKTEK